jgi:hypothetical protein
MINAVWWQLVSFVACVLCAVQCEAEMLLKNAGYNNKKTTYHASDLSK